MIRRVLSTIALIAVASFLVLFIKEYLDVNAGFAKTGGFSGARQLLAHQGRLFYAALYDALTLKSKAVCGSGIDAERYGYWVTTKDDLDKALEAKGLSHKIRVLVFDNGKVVRSPYRFNYLGYDSKKACSFVNDNGLEGVISGGENDVERMARLLHWAHTRWAGHYSDTLDGYDPSEIVAYKESSFSAPDILRYDAPLNRIDCVASSYLFAQAAASLGHQARIVNVADHVACEAWSDEYGKWVFMDPYYDVYFLKDGVPLSWLDLHSILRDADGMWGGREAGEFKDVVAFYQRFGAEVKSMSFDGVSYDGPTDGDTFHYLGNHIFGPVFAVNLRGDHIENAYPKFHALYHKYGKLNVLWRQDGVDYRYARINQMWRSPDVECGGDMVAPASQLQFSWQSTPEIEDLYWTLNQTQCYINPDGLGRRGKIEVFLDTFTPHYSSFYSSVNGGGWQRCPPRFIWDLKAGENEIRVRVRNRYGDFGAVSAVRLLLDEELR